MTQRSPQRVLVATGKSYAKLQPVKQHCTASECQAAAETASQGPVSGAISIMVIRMSLLVVSTEETENGKSTITSCEDPLRHRINPIITGQPTMA